MIPRLYVDAVLESGAAQALDDGQRHYLRNVLRREAGQEVLLFNDRDGEFDGTIEVLDKKAAIVRLGPRRRAPEPVAPLVLAFAPVKRAAVETIIQKGTELGVGGFQPVRTARTNADRLNLERLGAIAQEAAEQCDRLSVPGLAPIVSLDALLSGLDGATALIFCDEAGDDPEAAWGGPAGRAAPLLEVLQANSAGASAIAMTMILIGPEGGFAPDERAAIRAHPRATPVGLGPRILRADTAALAALAIWQAARGDSVWPPA